MQAVCPTCSAVIAAADINIGADTALCRACGGLMKASALAAEPDEGPFSLDEPPAGAWYRDEGNRIVVGGAVRHSIGYFLLGFPLVFLAIVATVVLSTSSARDPSALIFCGAALLNCALMGGIGVFCLFGRVEVSLLGENADVFTGVGSIGTRKRVRWGDVAAVTIAREAMGRVNGLPVYPLVLDGPTPVRFGTLLSDDRKRFVRRALGTMVRERSRREA